MRLSYSGTTLFGQEVLHASSARARNTQLIPATHTKDEERKEEEAKLWDTDVKGRGYVIENRDKRLAKTQQRKKEEYILYIHIMDSVQ